VLTVSMNDALGRFDRVLDNIAQGWAVNPDNREGPAVLDIFVDDQIVGGTTADLFRSDLQDAGIREGYAAFSFDIPLAYYDGEEHSVAVVMRETNKPVANSPLTFRGIPSEMPLIADRREWAERRLVMRRSRHADDLPGTLESRRKLAILSTYHAESTFFSYHYGMVDALTRAGFVVLVVHAGDSIGRGLDDMDRGDRFLYIKRNIGYDFGSWAVGVYAVADLLRNVSELILINDSVIGPVFDIEKVLGKIRSAGADIVGLTDSYEHSYHLQSYFLWLGPRICRSSTLLVFMARYSFSSDKATVIREGELGLTRFFTEQGFEASALFTYEKVAGAWLDRAPHIVRTIEDLPAVSLTRSNTDRPHSLRDNLLERMEAIVSSIVHGEPLNPAHYFWDVLVEDFGHPFLKRELLFINPSNVPTYFRIPDVLAQLPAVTQSHIMEARRRYGGKLVPFMR
jgi:hypothetical protein